MPGTVLQTDFVFEQIRAGGDRNFAYLLGDRKAGIAAVVDPAYEPARIHERARAQGLTIVVILATHGHPDHVAGVAELRKLTGAELGAWCDSPLSPELKLDDGHTVHIGRQQIRALHVPGHCPDHMLFFLAKPGIALTGDLLFVGKVGGTSGVEDARTEWESLRRVLGELPVRTTIWPGHDYGCRPSSTIAMEKLGNPFLRAPDFEAFYALKQDWPAYKARHGLL